MEKKINTLNIKNSMLSNIALSLLVTIEAFCLLIQ